MKELRYFFISSGTIATFIAALTEALKAVQSTQALSSFLILPLHANASS